MTFSNDLANLVAKETRERRADPDRMAEMIERIAHALAFSIAIAGRGDPKGMNTMLEGVTAYIYSEAAAQAPMGELAASLTSGMGTKS